MNSASAKRWVQIPNAVPALRGLFALERVMGIERGSQPVAAGEPNHPANGLEGGERAARSAPGRRRRPRRRNKDNGAALVLGGAATASALRLRRYCDCVGMLSAEAFSGKRNTVAFAQRFAPRKGEG